MIYVGRVMDGAGNVFAEAEVNIAEQSDALQKLAFEVRKDFYAKHPDKSLLTGENEPGYLIDFRPKS